MFINNAQPTGQGHRWWSDREEKRRICKQVKTGAHYLGKVQGDHHELDARPGVKDPAHYEGGEDVCEGHGGQGDAQPLAWRWGHSKALEVFPKAWENHSIFHTRDEHEQVNDGQAGPPERK